MANAEITRFGVLDMQVCVPEEWTDKEVKGFADIHNECGTSNGWIIRKEGDTTKTGKLFAGAPERCPCEEREGYVHIMLDA
jgi:hypothetical protein